MRSVLFAFLAVVPAFSSTVVNGGLLLSQSDGAQLATWLGQGDLTLINIFSLAPAANGATAFHSSVDGVGPTFVLIQTNRGLVGGFNPVSWTGSASGNYVINATDAGRNAFIFNLTTLTLLSQRSLSQATTPDGDTGQYQTFDYAQYGPAFGGGHDLVLYTSTLASGYAYSYSYGDARGGANVFGVSNAGSVDLFTATRVEAFTVSVNAVGTPEPVTVTLIAGGLATLALLRRRSGTDGPVH